MSGQPIPLSRRVALVRAAIARCEHAAEQYKESDLNLVELLRAETAFGEKWPEVKAILEALCPPEN